MGPVRNTAAASRRIGRVFQNSRQEGTCRLALLAAVWVYILSVSGPAQVDAYLCVPTLGYTCGVYPLDDVPYSGCCNATGSCSSWRDVGRDRCPIPALCTGTRFPEARCCDTALSNFNCTLNNPTQSPTLTQSPNPTQTKTPTQPPAPTLAPPVSSTSPPRISPAPAPTTNPPPTPPVQSNPNSPLTFPPSPLPQASTAPALSPSENPPASAPISSMPQPGLAAAPSPRTGSTSPAVATGTAATLVPSSGGSGRAKPLMFASKCPVMLLAGISTFAVLLSQHLVGW